MKRILLETLCAMAIVVFLASLHGRVSNLKENTDEVAELRTLVSETSESIGSIQESHASGIATLQALEAKLSKLERAVSETSSASIEARKLVEDIGDTRKAADRLKAELTEDLSRTQQIIDAYLEEMRVKHNSGAEGLRKTREDIALLACHMHRDPNTLSTELLSPAVQLNGTDTVGSGTLIYSGPNPKTKKVETYVITSYHVVRNIIADTPKAKREGIEVTIYHGDDAQTKREILRCDMVSHNAKIDAALLKLRSDKRFTNLARVASRKRATTIRVWDPIYAVGCPLGNDPIPSQGEVSSVRNDLNGTNYWMINAPTYFGNSGGGVFLADSRELIGVFSKIYTHGRGNPVVIPHMGLFTPLPAIYSWLSKDKLDFVLSNSTLPKRQPITSIEHLAAPAPR